MRKWGDVEVKLLAGTGAVGEEGERGGVGRPGDCAFAAVLAGIGGGGDAPAGGEIGKRGDANFLAGLGALNPGEMPAVGGDGNLADGAAAGEAAENFLDVGLAGSGGGVLRAGGDEEGRSDEEACGGKDGGNAFAERREKHGEMLAGLKAGSREQHTAFSS